MAVIERSVCYVFCKAELGWGDDATNVGIKPNREPRLFYYLSSPFRFYDLVQCHQPVFSVSLETRV